MARAAGEPSTKRAKVGEAGKEEEEDPLVRRKEEIVRLLERARSREDARAERVARRELVTMCADFEAKNGKLLRRLPPELWQKILDENLHQNDLPALAMTCRFFREKQKDLGWKMETELHPFRLLELRNSLGWFRWVCDTLEILPGFEKLSWERVKGAVYEGDLLNCAVFQGSVEILRWLTEEKGWELNEDTGLWAGKGGSVEVLKYLRGRGYYLGTGTCSWAASRGCLEALKFLRGLDPPCLWDEWTCACAAKRGHVELLKWLRLDQDPPCPWDEHTCFYAAEGGHLEVLKFVRGQDPPCPWSSGTCAFAAKGGQLEVLKWLKDQDPPCPWDERTCDRAAEGGHLEVLKFARGQDPPCPWNEDTCAWAAEGGHLEVLKWLRIQSPPCPWSRSACRNTALRLGHQHIVEWIDQQEDESDVEY